MVATIVALVASTLVTNLSSADEPNYYTVRPGDSLNTIAAQTGSTVRAIMASNNLETSLVFYGQRLSIPPLPGEIYSVVPGDTLVELANKHGASVGSIMRANLLSNTTIFAGQRLALPSSTSPFRPSSLSQEGASALPYVVRRGDSAIILAAEHNTNLLALMAMNNLTSTGLFVGQVLDLPPPCLLPTPGSVSGGRLNLAWPSTYTPLASSRFTPGHRGVDIGSPSGSPVYAAEDGQVAYRGWTDWGYGEVVVLSHTRGWQTLYAHLSEGLPNCGDRVRRGDLIGLSGSSGNSSGPHLHFEALYRGKHVNPVGRFLRVGSSSEHNGIPGS